ncbi:MAG: hypothetical protein EXQ86_11505 [Rhodospirillales bacterium]|nr:hypothetical protein [Rhodospirillales bacterium]
MIRRALFALLAVLIPTVLAAHSGTGPHGGKFADAGPYSVELIVQNDQIKVFVYDDKTEKPVNVKGAQATAVVLLGPTKESVRLQPDPAEKEGNLLSGKTTLKSGPGMRVIVQLQMPGQPSQSARFSL